MVHQQQPSLQQMKALAIVPKISGSLSLLGSLFVLQDILRNKKKRGESVYHKIMLGLSLFDAMSSAANIFSTWPSPSNSSIYGALGTTATCTAQGFFNEMGNLTTTLYVASLCVRYLLVVKYNWRESQLQKYEALFHLIPIAIGCTMSTIGLPLNLYNNAGWICWYATYPHGCTVDHSCTRGELANTFRWIHYGFLWSAIIFVTVSMILIYLKVKDQEQKAQYLRDQTDASTRRHAVVDTSESTMRKVSKRLSFTNLAMGESASELRQARKRTTNAKKVAVQASLYVGALYLTWIFATLTRILQTTLNESYFSLLLLMAIFFPLQGAFNAFIYVRPRYHRRNSNASGGTNIESQPAPQSSSVPEAMRAVRLADAGLHFEAEASSERRSTGAASGRFHYENTSASNLELGLGAVVEECKVEQEEEHHLLKEDIDDKNMASH